MNTRTLIATFNDYSTAKQAARELENAGVSADAIQIDSDQKTAGAGSTEYRDTGEHHSGFSAWWHDLFGSNSDDDRTEYEKAIEGGRTILRATVADSSLDSAVDILNRHGAVDVDSSSASTGSRMNDLRTNDTRTGASGPIPVVEEEMEIGKRALRRGGVRIYSHVVNQPVEEQVRLREEHVKVERRPVNRRISPDEVSTFRDQTIEVTETVEEPVIAKRAVVREEVVVSKEATERVENVRDNVRHTEVEVEQLGRETGRESAGPAYDYGYQVAGDPRYRGKSWDQVENDLRSDYERNNPGSRWDEAKSAIRNGWDKVTGKR